MSVAAGAGPASRTTVLTADRTDRRARRALRTAAMVPGAVVALVALVGPSVVGDRGSRIVAIPYTARSGALPLGSDGAGHDVWLRMLAGGRTLVLVPVLATVLTAVLGTGIGLLTGYLGGVVDAVVTRLLTMLIAVPPIVALLVLLNLFGASAGSLIVIVMITGVPFVARLARAATQAELTLGYAEQAVAVGENTARVLFGELLPNVVRPVVADLGARLAISFFIVAATAFLGFGSDGPNWAAMVSENLEGISLTPWGVVVPALAVAVLAVTANLALDRLGERHSP